MPSLGYVYPGHLVTMGETDVQMVMNIQLRLNDVGCGPISVNGVFDTKTRATVKLYQARFTDAEGTPLKIDGKIGPITWASLFGDKASDRLTTSSELMEAALNAATIEIGTLEKPLGSNSGPKVDKYLSSVDCEPGNPWCAAFVYWCFSEALSTSGEKNPLIKTAGVMDHWNKARRQGINCILTPNVIANTSLLRRGQIFIIATGSGKGHTGLVEDFERGKLITIEGNTSDGGRGPDIGVFRRSGRKLSDINKGFIDYES